MQSVHIEWPRACFARLGPGLAIGLALAAAAPAVAELSPITFTIHATSSAGSGSYEAQFSALAYDPHSGTYMWALPKQITIRNPFTNEVIAILNDASATYVDDPQVLVAFALTAGPTDTSITITSALNSFPGISDAQGRASAALTLTDVDGNGAKLNGLGPGGGAYLAQYNGLVPGGTTFAEMLNSVVAGPGGSTGADDETPGGGLYSAIPGLVSSMSAQFTFHLSANDIVTGSSNFTIIPIPEPGVVALVAMSVMVARRRRRRE